ncbi:hypothetical protein BGZ65_011775, partial [Modicella reniformis]
MTFTSPVPTVVNMDASPDASVATTSTATSGVSEPPSTALEALEASDVSFAAAEELVKVKRAQISPPPTTLDEEMDIQMQSLSDSEGKEGAEAEGEEEESET